MSNYVQSTNFATKDALPSGDPLKIVKGTEINTEFANIAIAVATKADTLSPTFTGAPAMPTGTTGVTQSFGNSATLLATTAFVQAALQALHPVGSVYTSTAATNPGTTFGFGTWVAFGAGRVLIGNGGGFSAGATGGSADAVLVSHTHTATSTVSDPSHVHTTSFGYSDNHDYFGNHVSSFTVNGQGVTANPYNYNSLSATTGITVATSNSTAGVSGTNANLQPYIVVYLWNRTA